MYRCIDCEAVVRFQKWRLWNPLIHFDRTENFSRNYEDEDEYDNNDDYDDV